MQSPQIIHTSRGQFAFREAGKKEAFPLIMIHGWPESSYCWHAVIEHLQIETRIICPDLRGLGDSERTLDKQAYLKNELAKDVLSIIDKMGIEQFYLAGHDWGGAVAQEMAFLIPNRITKLILANISVLHNIQGNMAAKKVLDKIGHYPSWYQYFQMQKGLAEAMIKDNEEVWLRHFLRCWNKEPFPEDAIQTYIQAYKKPHTPTTGANYYRTFRDDIRRWKNYHDKKHPMPTLYIYGCKDPVVMPPYLQGAENCFESLQIVEVEAGHFVLEEQPKKVATAINKFLDT